MRKKIEPCQSCVITLQELAGATGHPNPRALVRDDMIVDHWTGVPGVTVATAARIVRERHEDWERRQREQAEQVRKREAHAAARSDAAAGAYNTALKKFKARHQAEDPVLVKHAAERHAREAAQTALAEFDRKAA